MIAVILLAIFFVLSVTTTETTGENRPDLYCFDFCFPLTRTVRDHQTADLCLLQLSPTAKVF